MKYVSMFFLSVILMGCVEGCVNKPQATKASVALSIGVLSDQVDRAEKNSIITQATEDKLQDELYKAVELLGRDKFGAYTKHCNGVDSLDTCLDDMLRRVEEALRGAKARQEQ